MCTAWLIALAAIPAVGTQAQVAPPSDARESALPERLGPLEFVSPDGSTLGIGVASQLRVSAANAGGELGDTGRETDEQIEIRRLRLTLRGSFLDDRLRALVQLSFAPGNPELIDLWTEYVAKPALRIRLGQTKIPFTRHRGQSYAQLPLVEWDPAAVRFGSERQLGAMVHDGQRGNAKLNYALGVFSGVNARVAFARGISETYGEAPGNHSSLRSAPIPTELHPEVVGLLGYSSSNMDNVAVTDPEGGPARFFVAVSYAIDAAPEQTEDFLARLAPELLLKLHHVSLNLVGYGGFFDALQGASGLGMLGLTTELTYRFLPRWEVAGRYSRTDTLDRLRDDARARASRLVDLAAPAEADATREQYADAGRVRSLQEIALGLNVYIIARNLAWQSDLALLHTDGLGAARDEDQVRFRTQLQLTY
jgi:hypothetical protein